MDENLNVPKKMRKDIDISRGLNQNRPPLVVHAPVDCTVVEVLVEDAMEVEKGKPLFVLESQVEKGFSSWQTIPEWRKSNIKKSMERTSPVGVFPMKDVLLSQSVENGPMEKLDNVDVHKCYRNFKKFDIVVDHSDHLFSAQRFGMKQPRREWVNKIQEEWRILEDRLPDTIFVRVYESRIDLLRAVIIGQEGTPYHHGLFFFDVCFPHNYPDSPPLVRYHSGGLCINPNLYKCGEVCLELYDTYDVLGRMWVKGTCNMLQLLVDIQHRILNREPYFNKRPFMRGDMAGEWCSFLYNENTIRTSLTTMMYAMKKPPKNFEELVVGHFCEHVRDILMSCKAYTEGEKVGCLVSSGNNEITCSIEFKNEVASIVKPLVEAFCKIGAKEAQEFLYLSEKKAPVPPPTPEDAELCDCRWMLPACMACTVTEICVKEGMKFKKGQPLCRILAR